VKERYGKQGARLIQGETIATLRQLIDDGEQFDALLTDPPYSSGGLHIGAKSIATTTKYQQTQSRKRHTDFGGDSRDQLSFVTWCACWLNQCRQLLVPGAPVMMFCDWRQLGAAISALQAGGFTFRGVVAWDKKGGRPAAGRFRQQTEFVVWGSNGKMPKRDVYLPGVFAHATPPGKKRRHMTQKPVALLRDLLGIVPEGGRVLDPFAGSGSTLQACREMELLGTAIEEHEGIASDAVDWLIETESE